MNRRNAIRNGIMALCASLLPKILQPMDVEVVVEKDKKWILNYAKGEYRRFKDMKLDENSNWISIEWPRTQRINKNTLES